MESKGGKKSSSNSSQYEAPLGYSIEDVRPNGGVKKFQSAAYSNVGDLKIPVFESPFSFYSLTTCIHSNMFCMVEISCSVLASHPEKSLDSSLLE
ncbi:hypothetical protein KSP39_PZI012162 [Platanthera zijinensis]|uniref:Uncharacterized protein n=1 Tax=Platanthera zijinensis TaxID=2320716 RepID=A0AAP0BFW9_9ASPA